MNNRFAAHASVIRLICLLLCFTLLVSPFATAALTFEHAARELSAVFGSEAPPEANAEAPHLNLPDLNGLAGERAEPAVPAATTQSLMQCADCDPQSGGGGGGNHPPGDPNFGTSRMEPANETGEEGVDLGSRNFNWGLPLLALPGRAGLDLNLGLSYNSLVWTRQGNFIKYNADLGTPAPGFRLGLPILQQRFTNSQTGTNSYIMVTPGGRAHRDARSKLRRF